MIASTSCNSSPNPLHAAFMAILPRIETHAQIYHRDVPCPDQRQEKVAETIALAFKSLVHIFRNRPFET